MERQSFSVNFYVRAPKVNKHGTAPLEVALNVNGKRVFVSTQYRVTLEEWNKKKRSKALTDYMALMRARVNEILTSMLANQETVTAQSLVKFFKNGGYKAYSVDNLFNDFLEIKKGEVGKSITQNNYRKYELVRDLFYEFVDPAGEAKVQLTHAAVLKFKASVEGKYEQATAAGYLTKLKSVILFGIDNGKFTLNPFNGVKIKRGSKPIVYLKEWEQRLLESGRIENASLSKVRDFALMQISTGMSYADCSNVTKEDVKCKDGVYYIEKARQKTGKVFTCVIVQPERFMAIMDKYGGKAPKISNQKLNLWLKTIGELLGINTVMTTHCFRRTYSTNLLNAGVRIETVAAAMGHSVKMTERYYAKLQESTVLSEIASKII